MQRRGDRWKSPTEIRASAKYFLQNRLIFAVTILWELVDEPERGPIEIQFTPNFLQIPEKFFPKSTECPKNGPWRHLRSFGCFLLAVP